MGHIKTVKKVASCFARPISEYEGKLKDYQQVVKGMETWLDGQPYQF